MTQFYINFCDTEQKAISDQKKSSINGSGSHIPGNTSRHIPPTALKLGSEDSQLSGAYALQDWWRPVSCEARTRGSGEVLCAKKHVFSCVGSEQKLPITTDGTARGFQCDEGKSSFCLLYTSPSPRDGLLSRMPSSA